MKNRLILICALVLTLSSCGIYGKFKPKAEEKDRVAIPTYREVFADTQLLALIDTALAHNYDLRMAHERVEQANATLLGAKLAYLPSLSLSPSGTYSSATDPHMAFTLASASWEIDIFGRLTNRKRMAKASKEQMEDYEQAARCELIASVANTYYALLMLDAQIVTADSSVVNWQRSVETMQEMKKAGMTDEAAVSQFEASYYNCRALYSGLLLQRVQTENAMRLLLALDLNQPIERTTIEAQTLTNELDSVNLQVTRFRPDVRAAEHQLEQAFYSVNLARANCCPSISITGSLGWGSGLIYGAVAGLVQPIFNAGKNIAEVRQSKSAKQEAEYGYASALLKAGTEVNNALAAKHTYHAQTADYERQVESLVRALDATQMKMRLGSGTYLEVLTAQNNLLTAQFSLIQNRTQILQSQADLFQAIGGK